MIAQSFADLHKTIAFLAAQHIQQMKCAGNIGQVFAFYDTGGFFAIIDPTRLGAGPDGQFGVCVSRLPGHNVKVRAAAGDDLAKVRLHETVHLFPIGKTAIGRQCRYEARHC